MNLSGQKILYIEDDPVNRKLVSKLLYAEGCTVLEAQDGIAGIDLACSEKPDLILMDIHMPGLEGTEVATRLKALPEVRDIPIVAITADDASGVRERSLVAGCVGYIAKPIDVDRFAGQLAEYLAGKHETLSTAEKSRRLNDYARDLVARLETKVRELDEANRQLEGNLAEVKRARDAALEADAMKTEFLNVMAHEMRTPLNAIIGFGQLLLGEAGDQESREGIRTILGSGQQLQALVDKALDLSRLQAQRFILRPEVFLVSDVIHSVIAKYLAQAGSKGLFLHGKDCGAELLAYGDVQQIARIFEYLLDNAVHFTNQGGVELRCQAIGAGGDEIPPAWASHMGTLQGAIVVMVQDSGPGITDKNAAKVFEPFRQVDGSLTRSHEGAGLSLALARRIMLLHKGELWFENREGGGTTFFVLIPAAP